MTCCGGARASDKSVVVVDANQPPQQELYKLLMIGDSGVGKTRLLMQFLDETYRFGDVTIVDFRIKTVELDGQPIKLQIWDTGGHERFRTIRSSHYRGAHGIMVVYDVTKEGSFDGVQRWLREIERFATREDVSRIIVGNMCDRTDKKVVDYTIAKEFADGIGVPFIETSAKSNINVEQAFITLVAEVKKAAEAKAKTKN